MAEIIKVDFKKKTHAQIKQDQEIEEMKDAMNLLVFMIYQRTGNREYAKTCVELFERIVKRCSN